MPTSSSPPPPDSCQAPSSAAPVSSGTAGGSGSEDTINQALQAVLASFPTGTSPLLDLVLDSSDDSNANITVVVEDTGHGAEMQPVLDALTAQFQSLNITQAQVLSFTTPDDSGPDSEPPDSTPPSGAPASG